MLNAFYMQSLAYELIKREAPTPIVHKATGISPTLIRKMFRQFHGFSASSGSSKQSTQGIVRNKKLYKETTVFAICYQTTKFKVNESDIHKIMIAFDAFKKIHPSSQLDFSAAYVIVNDLLDRKVELTRCRCESWVLRGVLIHGYEHCVVCKSTLNH